MQQTIVITDTSVLINLLVLDRAELLSRLPNYRFLITEHVRKEITTHYAAQLERLQRLLDSGAIAEISVTELEELKLFAELTHAGLGIGECSAIAVAVKRGFAIAIDDKTAIKRIHAYDTRLVVITTESLVLLLIKHQIISIEEADRMKEEWEAHYRFRLPFHSFADRL